MELPEYGPDSIAQPLVDGASPANNASAPREVSASTIGRMMGLATVAELRLLEGKIDLLTSKLTAITVKLDKLQSTTANFPSGSDLERIDIQIGSLKNLIKEAITGTINAGQGAVSGAHQSAPDAKKPKASVFVKPEEAQK